MDTYKSKVFNNASFQTVNEQLADFMNSTVGMILVDSDTKWDAGTLTWRIRIIYV